MVQQFTSTQSSDLNEITTLLHFLSQISIKFNEYAIFKHGLIACTRSKSCWSRLEMPLLDHITGSLTKSDQSIKVPCKPILLFLKSGVNPDCTVIEQTEDNLIITQKSVLGIEKVIELYIEEVPDLIPLYNLETSNSFKTSPKVLLDILSSFPESLDYVTLNCAQDSFSVQTWSENGEHRTMDTLVSIDLQDFIEYVISDPCNLTVNYKDFKRVLTFANGGTNVEMSILFDGPGRYYDLLI
jgi:Rad9